MTLAGCKVPAAAPIAFVSCQRQVWVGQLSVGYFPFGLLLCSKTAFLATATQLMYSSQWLSMFLERLRFWIIFPGHIVK